MEVILVLISKTQYLTNKILIMFYDTRNVVLYRRKVLLKKGRAIVVIHYFS
jgi:hypothetical protein